MLDRLYQRFKQWLRDRREMRELREEMKRNPDHFQGLLFIPDDKEPK
jgi:hypothetical protein